MFAKVVSVKPGKEEILGKAAKANQSKVSIKQYRGKNYAVLTSSKKWALQNLSSVLGQDQSKYGVVNMHSGDQEKLVKKFK